MYSLTWEKSPRKPKKAPKKKIEENRRKAKLREFKKISENQRKKSELMLIHYSLN